jgi:hypothetical protein
MLRNRNLFISFSSLIFILLSLLTLNKPIKAQEQLGCFMLNSSGQLINLNAFCGQSESLVQAI